MDDLLDAIVVGAGPAGVTAARELAKAGLAVVVLERGQFPGAKNVWGGILYREPTEALLPGFEAEAPLERPIIEQRYVVLTEDAMLGATYRSQRFAAPPYNAYAVLRSPFDRWHATTAEAAGAEVYPEFAVTDLIWEDGAVAGITTGEPDGELRARCVVLADGANSLLAQKVGLHKEWAPIEQALVAKELIALPAEKIEDRFALPAGQGTALEIFGESTWGLLGYGFVYTNNESLSIGTGALLEDLIRTGYNVNDMLDRFKRHPAIAPLIAGGETVEYSAHLIPEGGYNRMPQVYADGVLVVGDAAGFVNPLNREGVNLAMLSAKLAAQTIVEAKARDDFSAATLSRYRELLEESIVIQDLYKIRNVTDFAHARPHLLRDYPALASEIARSYLTVDGLPKREKQSKIAGMLRGLPKKRLLGDAVGALRSLG
ncbi:MAG: Electron transfer flavoprotein-quinone oxidoreductase [uncultured Thermomicrobiales bacterium]|uniref:Electron transfer flavoprotein-quinone oxidoreductase n=1 Tax=uncultured Thermomicrobiales bacterium TaxID=1645740 RepID=A0A6J4VFL9_9BACT|nr:MAG: Electron transfer flavoprotein-quinone oxidoreductase [uncultured Thermomicrobiales bacterium]